MYTLYCILYSVWCAAYLIPPKVNIESLAVLLPAAAVARLQLKTEEHSTLYFLHSVYCSMYTVLYLKN